MNQHSSKLLLLFLKALQGGALRTSKTTAWDHQRSDRKRQRATEAVQGPGPKALSPAELQLAKAQRVRARPLCFPRLGRAKGRGDKARQG